MQVATTTDYSFRDRLIEIIDDEKAQKNLYELKQNAQFIDSLVKQYIDEIAESLETQDIWQTKYGKLKDIGTYAKSSDDCIDYAYILFLTHSFSNPYSQEWAHDWLAKKQECRRQSSLIRFLYARMTLFSSHASGNKTVEKTDAFDDLKEILKTDYKTVIDAMYRLDRIMLSTFEKHENLLDWYYNNYHEIIFPEVSKELYPKAVSSFYHAICAEYYRIAGKREENEELKEKQEEESEEALDLYGKNSLALVQVAYIKAKEDPKKAKKMFEEALCLAEDQFKGFRTTRISVQAMAHAGLGYLYSRSYLYSNAEKCYEEALSKISSPSVPSFLRSLRPFILLNRGRSRLDDGEFQKAKEDFEEAANDPDLLPLVETNLGILYYKQSFNKKAKSKFNHAIELKSDLGEAYYNLGVVYNEERRKEKAIKLFKTALEVEGGLSEAHNALEKLEGSKVQDVRDWYNWWFGGEAKPCKRILGTVFVALILWGISLTFSDMFVPQFSVSESIFGVLGFALIFLVLPLITKLKVGTIEVEMESKGERPLLYYANGLSLKPA